MVSELNTPGQRYMYRIRNLPLTLIHPPKGLAPLELGKLWRYRDLLYLFVWRDIKVRYKQTFVGTAWALLQPLIACLVLTLFFGKLARISSGEVPYPIFAYTALVPWTYFVNALTHSSNSLIFNSTIITRVYFPRLIIPISAVATGLLDFAIALLILFGLMVFYGIIPTLAVLTLPFFMLMSLATALGFGLWLAVLNVEYRDIKFILPFLTQIWLFATPVAYPSNLVPEKWRIVYGLNPMAGVVDGFRWAILGTNPPHMPLLIASITVVTILLIGGLFFFRYKEDTFADVV